MKILIVCAGEKVKYYVSLNILKYLIKIIQEKIIMFALLMEIKNNQIIEIKKKFFT